MSSLTTQSDSELDRYLEVKMFEGSWVRSDYWGKLQKRN